MNQQEEVHKILSDAIQLLRKGEQYQARSLAEKALAIDSNSENAWLILAATASPRASIEYFKQVLRINPSNKYAINGIKWAGKKLLTQTSDTPATQQKITRTASTKAQSKRHFSFFPILLILILGVIGAFAIFRSNIFSTEKEAYAANQINNVKLNKATRTFTPTSTFTPTFTPTPTSTFTPTPTSTNTPTPTTTFTPSPTPSKKAKKKSKYAIPPKSIKGNQKWIDVDLSKQRLFAYEGTNKIKIFIVSTGTWQHPTVIGTFRIYVKYRYANMRGPGYNLPNVPYSMYFYKGYGLHGTYWHHNFGHPMSHGCVNLRTIDAKWLYNWAPLGTIVRVHR